MKVISKKRLKLSQAINSLIGSIRAEKGCRSCDLCRSLENENELCLIEEWDNLENFRAHQESEHFRVLRGAMNLLEEPCNETIHTVLHSEAGKVWDLMDESLSEEKVTNNKPVHNHISKRE